MPPAAASDQRQGPEPRGPPRLRLDGGRVIPLRHDDRRDPLAIADRKGGRTREVALAAVLERVAGRHARAELLHDLPDERRVLAGRHAGRVDAARSGDEVPVARGDEDPTPGRHVELAHEARQAVEREVHREDPTRRAGAVEEGRRARDPESPVVEAVGLRPRNPAPRLGQAVEGLLARPVSVVVRLPHALPAAIGKDAVLLEPDPAAAREAPVHVELIGAVGPGADEAVRAVAVADPGKLGGRAQHAERVLAERPEVVRIEQAARDERGTQPDGTLRVADERRGVVGGHARRLRHRAVHQGARPRVLLPPRQGAEGGAGRRRQQRHQTHQGERDRRAVEDAARGKPGVARAGALRHGTNTLLSFRGRPLHLWRLAMPGPREETPT